MFRKKAGFTLIELVIVIAVLGILAGIAIPRFLDAQATARGSKIVADMRTMESALTLYQIDHPIKSKPEKGFIKTALVDGDKKYLAAMPTVPIGTARFEKGLELDIDSSCYYEIYWHSASGASIALYYYGNDFGIDRLSTMTNN